jgi:hypothetical protein
MLVAKPWGGRWKLTSTEEATDVPARAWRKVIHAPNMQVDDALHDAIDGALAAALGGLRARVVCTHVRLYGEEGGCTCYMGVTLSPSGSVARGDRAADAREAVERAATRLGAAVYDFIGAREWRVRAAARR